MDMIPREKSNAVARGLSQAFGTTTIDDVCRMTRGLSSDLVFRILVQGSPFLLRVMTRIDERNDPTRLFTAMKAATDTGLAPRVWYTNIEDGITIIDFVGTVPLSTSEALVRLPATLRRLHALPPFPEALNYITAHKAFMWPFQSANLLPSSEIDEVFSRYAQVAAVYPRLDSDMVSCHNDLKPENILFEGQRVWLIDWQAAFVNDRYFDLAIIANFVVNNDIEEKAFLEAYFGQPPDEYQLARFFLMRQIMHVWYATVWLMLGSSGKPVDQSEKAPEFVEFHKRIWAGEITLAGNEARVVYGRVHWERLLQNLRQARFEESLRIVSDRHAREVGVRRLLPEAP